MAIANSATVDDILCAYPTLGVPHFQRGLVWDSSSVALLLESLFHHTPCGTLMFWETPDAEREGVPLVPGGKLDRLIVDGQQRIRSLASVFLPGRSSADERDDSPAANSVWCLNLFRVEELRKFFPEPGRFALFRRLANPRHDKSVLKHNLIPLELFFSGVESEIADLVQVKDGRDAVLRQLFGPLRERVRSIRTTPLFHSVTLMNSRLAEVVEVFNRINSAGRRVEIEERAWATLVSLVPSASDWLRDTFTAIHGPMKEGPGLERDESMRRRKERNFGFKLFVKSLVQVCAHHFGFSLGTQSFSFDVIHSRVFQQHFKREENALRARQVLEQTTELLRQLRGLLNELDCDDLQHLPDTSSLEPIVHLLVRFPGLSEHKTARAYLRASIVRLLLVPPSSQDEVRKLVRQIDRTESGAEALRLVDDTSRTYVTRDRIDKALEGANSLTHRAVLLLYWLLRRRSARDFSYEQSGLPEGSSLRRHRGAPPALSEEISPEKQHVVPYSTLAGVFELEKRGRLSRHSVNNIGNLTFISAMLNSFTDGLGSTPLDLASPPQHEANLESHFLAGKNRDDLLSAYRCALDDTATHEQRKGAYAEFCRLRRALMVEGFLSWLEKETPKEEFTERVEPAPRLFQPTLADQIRELDFPNEVEDALIECVKKGRVKVKRLGEDDEPLSLELIFEADGRSRLAVLRLMPPSVVIEPTSRLHASRVLEGLQADGAAGHCHLRVNEDTVKTVEANLRDLAKRLQELSGTH